MLKETKADLEVKRKFWGSVRSELMYFAGKYADEHVAGMRTSDAQKDCACAAKRKGYPKTVIKEAASYIRRDMEEDLEHLIGKFQHKLGLELNDKQ